MKFTRKTLSTLLGLALSVNMSQGYASAEDKALLDVLLENGVITKDQHAELSKKYGKAEDKEIKVTTKGGIKAKSGDGNFDFQFGGRIMVDAAHINDDNTDLAPGSGTEFRRVRLFAKGTLYHDWGYKVQIDYADNKVSLKDAYIKYKPYSITFGQFKQPFSLEELTSSKYITFMERALPNVLATGRRIGVGWNGHWDNVTLAASAYGQGTTGGKEGDEGFGAGARITFSPIHEKTRAFHLGASIASENPDSTDVETIRIRQRPESHITTRLVDTGTITMVDHINKWGVEIAGVAGPFSAQAEYINMDISRDDGFEDLEFDGWYAYASWFLTGESRPYKFKKGSFGRVKPKSKKIGAWEAALRYSSLNLNDMPIYGGEEDNWTVGLNWYVNPHLRFMANYIDVDTDNYAGDEDPSIFQVRAQIDF